MTDCPTNTTMDGEPEYCDGCECLVSECECPDEVECETCNGTGVEDYYVGTYGTSSCKGPAERECTDCDGRGYHDA